MRARSRALDTVSGNVYAGFWPHMKTLTSLSVLAAVLAFAQGVPQRDRVVVVISLDGLPAWALADPQLPAPTLRRLQREGASARAMHVSNPSVTWPNHTTMVTGVPPARHGVLVNGMVLREGARAPLRVEPWRDKAEMVRSTTVYDVAHRAGLTTAQVDWVAIHNPGTITWAFPERPDPTGAEERELVAEGRIPEADLAQFAKLNVTLRDEYWTRAAVHMLEKHRPNLLLFHVLNLDSIHHRYGPGTDAGRTAIAYADTRVSRILDAIERANLAKRATVLVVSDHGFKATKRSIRANAVLRSNGLVTSEGGRIACDAWSIPEGGTALLYVTDPENRTRLVPKLRSMFGSVEGVDRVLGPEEFAQYGMPTPQENPQMADLVLTAKEGYAFGTGHEGAFVVDQEGGAHGYLSTDPQLDAIFIAWGRGIRPGARLDAIDNLAVAPTIAALLGLEMPGVAGRKLEGLLQPE
jgi:predicted AlkP superfamily pyrophosphatase or phosphodiesterase